jgi:hypothetical protein
VDLRDKLFGSVIIIAPGLEYFVGLRTTECESHREATKTAKLATSIAIAWSN